MPARYSERSNIHGNVTVFCAPDGASGWHGASHYTGWNSAKVGYVKLNTLFFIFGLFKVDSVRYWQSGRKVRANREKGTDKQGERYGQTGRKVRTNREKSPFLPVKTCRRKTFCPVAQDPAPRGERSCAPWQKPFKNNVMFFSRTRV